jgi:hypothetical protein
VKLWYGYGTEHSMNLVMIGSFKDAGTAEKAKALIDELTTRVGADVQAGAITIGDGTTSRFTDSTRELLYAAKIYSLGPSELEQFAYDVSADVEHERLVIRTDEVDVSAFLKLMVEFGARVEVYSAHEYPETGDGRR